MTGSALLKAIDKSMSGTYTGKNKLFKDRTGSYHALAVLKRCRSATRLDNLSFFTKNNTHNKQETCKVFNLSSPLLYHGVIDNACSIRDSLCINFNLFLDVTKLLVNLFLEDIQ